MKEETAKTSIGPMLPFLCVMHGETQGPAVPGANMPAYTEELRTFPHQGAPARGKITQPCRCVRPRQQQELLRSGPMAQNEKRLVKKRSLHYDCSWNPRTSLQNDECVHEKEHIFSADTHKTRHNNSVWQELASLCSRYREIERCWTHNYRAICLLAYLIDYKANVWLR